MASSVHKLQRAYVRNIIDSLEKLNLDLVINTCGPFQGQDYHVAQACIHNGIDYIESC